MGKRKENMGEKKNMVRPYIVQQLNDELTKIFSGLHKKIEYNNRELILAFHFYAVNICVEKRRQKNGSSIAEDS